MYPRNKEQALVIDRQRNRAPTLESLIKKFAGLTGAEIKATMSVNRDEGAEQLKFGVAVKIGLASRLGRFRIRFLVAAACRDASDVLRRHRDQHRGRLTGSLR